MKSPKAYESSLVAFQKKINYTFHNINLLKEALIHPSYANELGLPFSNQRLEFLGDAVLELVASEALFKEDMQASEGLLTRARSQLVRKDSLCSWADHSGIAALLLYGKSIGRGGVTASMTADAAESFFGAVFADGGYEAARSVVTRYLDFVSGEVRKNELDPKTELQQLLQAKGTGVPYYKAVDRKGPDHALHFKVEVSIGEELLASAWGKSMQEAEFAAARIALASIKKLK